MVEEPRAHKVLQVQVEPVVLWVHKVLRVEQVFKVFKAHKAHKVLQVQVEPVVLKVLKAELVFKVHKAHKVLQVQVEPVVL